MRGTIKFLKEKEPDDQIHLKIKVKLIYLLQLREADDEQETASLFQCRKSSVTKKLFNIGLLKEPRSR